MRLYGYQILIGSLPIALIKAIYVSPLRLKKMRNTIMSFNNGKASVPDGFPILFSKKCWHIFKGDLMAAIEDFYNK